MSFICRPLCSAVCATLHLAYCWSVLQISLQKTAATIWADQLSGLLGPYRHHHDRDDKRIFRIFGRQSPSECSVDHSVDCDPFVCCHGCFATSLHREAVPDTASEIHQDLTGRDPFGQNPEFSYAILPELDGFGANGALPQNGSLWDMRKLKQVIPNARNALEPAS